MKVRHKRLVDSERTRWTLLEESETFFICRRDDVSHFQALAKVDYEIVPPTPPEPRWQDVTGECEWRELKDGNALSHHTGGEWEPEIGCNVMVSQTLGYRLRKVRMTSEPSGIMRDAFIVERKVSE